MWSAIDLGRVSERVSQLAAGTNRDGHLIQRSATTWHAEDHYLDLVVGTGAGAELSDVDERLTAVRHGLLPPRPANAQCKRPSARLTGLSRHDYDLNRWRAASGMALTWPDA
jgi:uncharacterized protein